MHNTEYKSQIGLTEGIRVSSPEKSIRKIINYAENFFVIIIFLPPSFFRQNCMYVLYMYTNISLLR